MRIVGKWLVFDDGETRPMMRVKVRTPESAPTKQENRTWLCKEAN
jgi:hypothetical protein